MRTMKGESGAVVVQVVFVLAVLVALSAFVIDYGLLLVARTQAQTAADAAAMGGAYARAMVNEDPGQVAVQAVSVALQNEVWMSAPSIGPADVTVGPCVNPEPFWAAGDECVTATVYRTVERGNALPTIFASFFGLKSQNITAQATARVASSYITDCLRPWAIPDKWVERSDCNGDPTGAWTGSSTFDTVYCSGPNRGAPLPNPDVYIPPSKSNPGTGFTTADYGKRLVLKSDDAMSAGWFGSLVVPRADNGGVADFSSPTYVKNIVSCNGVFTAFGAQIATLPGNRVGPTQQGVDQLIAADSNAYWDAGKKRIRGGCMGSGACAKSSRLVAVGAFDVNDFANGANPGKVTIRNLMGFFIEGFDGHDLIGYLTYYPGIATKGEPQLPGQSSFLKKAVLAH